MTRLRYWGGVALTATAVLALCYIAAVLITTAVQR